jgi:membrane protease subunit (stomatin/prohibitin family)
MEIEMNPEQKELLHEFEHFKWGTTSPVTLMLYGDFMSLHAWGTCSVEPADLSLFDAETGDVDEMRARVKALIPLRLAEVLAEAAVGKSTLDELVAERSLMEKSLKRRINADFKSMGLVIALMSIDSINSL